MRFREECEVSNSSLVFYPRPVSSQKPALKGMFFNSLYELLFIFRVKAFGRKPSAVLKNTTQGGKSENGGCVFVCLWVKLCAAAMLAPDETRGPGPASGIWSCFMALLCNIA